MLLSILVLYEEVVNETNLKRLLKYIQALLYFFHFVHNLYNICYILYIYKIKLIIYLFSCKMLIQMIFLIIERTNCL